MTRPRWSQIVKASLASHSWLGLAVGGLMYVICLSGTLAVFYQELERWEQPAIEEIDRYEPAAAQRAVANLLDRLGRTPEHVYVSVPTPDAPRLSVSSDQEDEAWFVNHDGSLGEAVAHGWTHLVLDLHIYLHLPSTLGLLVVGALGALLLGLIVSGFLAHPRIFKDAFRWRQGGALDLDQADLHNRLSVWGAPFHLVIALTGACFGLASVLFLLLGTAFHGGDTTAAIAAIYAPEPIVRGTATLPEIAKALQQIDRVIPAGTSPSLITVHDAGTTKQYIEVEAVYPGRLTWAEYYRFGGDGTYLGRSDYSDGPLGRQIVYSTYRVHFGQFGGWPVKLLYAALGLSLTVISVTGINIWLARRKVRDYLNDLWAGSVWGAPMALAFTAITAVLFGVPSNALFWLALVVSMAWALRVKQPVRAKRDLCAATAVLLAGFLAGYVARFGASGLSPAAWWVNGGLLVAAVAMALTALRASAGTATAAGTVAVRIDPVTS